MDDRPTFGGTGFGVQGVEGLEPENVARVDGIGIADPGFYGGH